MCGGCGHCADIALLDAKYRPQGAAGGDAAGVGNATTGSATDKLTREHRMTVDEARLILNVKKEDSVERVLQVRRAYISRSWTLVR